MHDLNIEKMTTTTTSIKEEIPIITNIKYEIIEKIFIFFSAIYLSLTLFFFQIYLKQQQNLKIDSLNVPLVSVVFKSLK